jgi:hypothetical protein
VTIDLSWYAQTILEEEFRSRPGLGTLHFSNFDRLHASLTLELTKRMIAFGESRLPEHVLNKYRGFLHEGSSDRALALAEEHIPDFSHLLMLELTDFKRDYLTHSRRT